MNLITVKNWKSFGRQIFYFWRWRYFEFVRWCQIIFDTYSIYLFSRHFICLLISSLLELKWVNFPTNCLFRITGLQCIRCCPLKMITFVFFYTIFDYTVSDIFAFLAAFSLHAYVNHTKSIVKHILFPTSNFIDSANDKIYFKNVHPGLSVINKNKWVFIVEKCCRFVCEVEWRHVGQNTFSHK